MTLRSRKRLPRPLIPSNAEPESEDALVKRLFRLVSSADELAAGMREITDLNLRQREGEELSPAERTVASFEFNLQSALCAIRQHTTALYGSEEDCQARERKLRQHFGALSAMSDPE